MKITYVLQLERNCSMRLRRNEWKMDGELEIYKMIYAAINHMKGALSFHQIIKYNHFGDLAILFYHDD